MVLNFINKFQNQKNSALSFSEKFKFFLLISIFFFSFVFLGTPAVASSEMERLIAIQKQVGELDYSIRLLLHKEPKASAEFSQYSNEWNHQVTTLCASNTTCSIEQYEKRLPILKAVYSDLQEKLANANEQKTEQPVRVESGAMGSVAQQTDIVSGDSASQTASYLSQVGTPGATEAVEPTSTQAYEAAEGAENTVVSSDRDTVDAHSAEFSDEQLDSGLQTYFAFFVPAIGIALAFVMAVYNRNKASFQS